MLQALPNRWLASISSVVGEWTENNVTVNSWRKCKLCTHLGESFSRKRVRMCSTAVAEKLQIASIQTKVILKTRKHCDKSQSVVTGLSHFCAYNRQLNTTNGIGVTCPRTWDRVRRRENLHRHIRRIASNLLVWIDGNKLTSQSMFYPWGSFILEEN